MLFRSELAANAFAVYPNPSNGHLAVRAGKIDGDMTISVFEDYGSLGKCPVDSGSVTVFDEIIDQEKFPVTLVVKNGDALRQTTTGLKRYETAGNTPNIFAGRVDANSVARSYQKSLTVVPRRRARTPSRTSTGRSSPGTGRAPPRSPRRRRDCRC